VYFIGHRETSDKRGDPQKIRYASIRKKCRRERRNIPRGTVRGSGNKVAEVPTSFKIGPLEGKSKLREENPRVETNNTGNSIVGLRDLAVSGSDPHRIRTHNQKTSVDPTRFSG